MRVFIAVVLIFVSIISHAAPIKKAFKLIQKKEFLKLEKVLQKSFKKDSLDASAEYIYSLIFVNKDFPRYSIDSAYYFINRSLVNFKRTDPKKIEKLQKQNINEQTLLRQKTKIDSLAYEVASQLDTEQGYNIFLKKHPGAVQTQEVIERRNELAFATAKRINTYTSYKHFMETYPDAKQAKDAKEVYDFLLFEGQTKDKKLISYINFLKAHPETPYREEAEKNIYEISTADNDLKSYALFLKSFPKSPIAKRATNFLYHNYKASENAVDFLKEFPSVTSKDSLKTIIDLEKYILIPFYENNLYGFMDSEGKILLPATFQSIKPEYLCEPIKDDFLLVGDINKLSVISRNRVVLYNEKSDEVKDLGNGLLKIGLEKKYTLIHKAGYKLFDHGYDDFGLVNKQFIKYKIGEKWGLQTFSGRQILDTLYDDIYTEGPFILVVKDKKIAISNGAVLVKAADKNPIHLSHLYDDIELIHDNFILGYNDDNETMINDSLQIIMPLEDQTILYLNNGFLIKHHESYKYYNANMKLMSDTVFDNVQYNKNWLALKKADQWLIFDQFSKTLPTFSYDSVKILSEHIALVKRNDTSYALFSNDMRINTNFAVRMKLLNQEVGELGEDSAHSEYLLAIDKKGNKTVYNNKGKKIFTGKYDNISALGEEYLVLEKKKKKGMTDRNGKIILPLIYDGIGHYENGFVTTLKKSKFGIFNPIKKVNISPLYDKRLLYYNEDFFIDSKKGKLDLISRQNKEATKVGYEEIQFWTDSVALVKTKMKYSLLDIYKKKIIVDSILNFDFVINQPKNKTIIFRKETGYGVISSQKGMVIPPIYNDLINIGTKEQPFYFSEKHDADVYNVVYLSANGEIIREQVLSETQYDKIYCE